ncbi:uncharacterized protein [Phaenicophaeus curvirostris]|uniref:uncharacterized protein n=1 Tax=Phaenicophaeus curvirostris TaxID=33595 RepID=UPI0037F0971A
MVPAAAAAPAPPGASPQRLRPGCPGAPRPRSAAPALPRYRPPPGAPAQRRHPRPRPAAILGRWLRAEGNGGVGDLRERSGPGLAPSAAIRPRRAGEGPRRDRGNAEGRGERGPAAIGPPAAPEGGLEGSCWDDPEGPWEPPGARRWWCPCSLIMVPAVTIQKNLRSHQERGGGGVHALPSRFLLGRSRRTSGATRRNEEVPAGMVQKDLGSHWERGGGGVHALPSRFLLGWSRRTLRATRSEEMVVSVLPHQGSCWDDPEGPWEPPRARGGGVHALPSCCEDLRSSLTTRQETGIGIPWD